MSKAKRFLHLPIVTAILAMLAIALLLAGSIGGTRAALNAVSYEYHTEIDTSQINVALLENGKVVAGEDALMQGEALLGKDKQIIPGKTYKWELAAQNNGAIPEYVRVTIRKYWVDNNTGKKLLNLDPAMIKLDLVTSGAWKLDAGSTTAERTVLYYQALMGQGGSSVFCKSLTLDPDLEMTTYVTTEKDGNTTIYHYAYESATFKVEVEVDGVQDYDGNAAMTSAWGRTNG